MDNKVFNVNGKTKEQLKLAVQLLLLDEYGKRRKVSGWYFEPKKGFVLTWYVGDSQKRAIPFTNRMGQPEDIGEDELTDLLWEWLKSDEAKSVKLEGWDKKFVDSDVSTEGGWRLFTDQWGHVSNHDGHTIDHYSLAAFTKAYMWYGK